MYIRKRLCNLAILLLCIAFLFSCSKKNCTTENKTLPTIKIGISNSEAPAIVRIADTFGFFKKNKLNYKLFTYSSGREAANALLNNEIHISTSGDYVFVSEFQENTHLRIIGTAAKLKNNFIVSTESKYCNTPNSFKGKTVGILKNSSPHYFFESFLTFHNIGTNQITYRFENAPVIKQLIIDGQIDCGILWGPYICSLEKTLHEPLTKWPLHTYNPMFFLILSNQQTIDTLGHCIVAFTKAMVEAEEWISNNPDKAKAYIKSKIQYEDSYFEKEIWPNFSIRFELTQELLVSVEEQFIWKAQRDSSSAAIKNFNYIHYQTLAASYPERVTIVH